MSYKNDIDYQAKINEAVAVKDYKSAAQYEKSRNEKIDGEKLPYQKTNNYSGWLDDTDYSTIIKNNISSGANRDKVASALKKRINKSSGTIGLSQYAYDDVYDEAIAYIMGGNSFSYEENKPEFKSKYAGKLSSMYDDIMNRKDFSYDPYSDELYKYYKEQYNREGQRAMEDLLGEISMNTGGIASSYAVSAAGQMLENYNNKLTDKIPELYMEAYKRYMDELDREEKEFSMLSELSENEYDRYLDELGQYNKDREMAYNSYNDTREREQWEKEYDAERADTDAEYKYLIEKLRKDEEEVLREWEQQKYENNRKEKQQDIDNALEKWEALGYLDKESARILGLPEGLHTSDYDYKRAQEYSLYHR